MQVPIVINAELLLPAENLRRSHSVRLVIPKTLTQYVRHRQERGGNIDKQVDSEHLIWRAKPTSVQCSKEKTAR